MPDGPMRTKRVTLADVAAHAGVDPSLVSRVINNDTRLVVRHETRQRVHESIRELGYHPNAAARSLRTDRSGTLGLLIPDFANPIYAEIIKGAEQAATERGRLLFTGTAFGDKPERYVEMLASGAVEGLILAADVFSPDTLAALAATGRPIVSVNQRIPSVRQTIIADDERAAQLAVEHLIGLGHERIAHIRGPQGSDTAERRLAGFRRALAGAGAGVPDKAQVAGFGYTVEAGAAAIGALTAARASGVRVPDFISVVAIHDIPLAANLAPALTTIRMPLAEMGRSGVAALLDPEPHGSSTVVVGEPTELVIRESTRALA